MGRNIAGMRENEVSDIRRKDIAFIFQNINLISDLTSFENIAYPAYLAMPKAKANQIAEQLLNDFGLMEQRDKYPGEMSGGQQQRIAILRAIAGGPKVIFADEPTGALNSKAGTQVLNLLTQLNEGGQSVVMVTHDTMTSVRGNRLLFLSDGQITGDLNLGRYNPAEQAAREEKVFRFLKEHQW
jgi:putative ABC transport system ATP-binding protein